MLIYTDWLYAYDKETADVRGKAFERLCKRWLASQPNVDKVWLWEEYPSRKGIDMGIDIVVRNKDGQLWAVQCKNYDHTILWSHIATFVGASVNYDRRILMVSRNDVSTNALKQMGALGIEYLDPSIFDGFDCSTAPVVVPKIELRDYQREAVNAARKALRGGKHATLVMPTGSGKTVVFSRIASNKRFMFAVPSIFLASQSARAFLADKPGRKAIIVCSDSTTGNMDERWAGVPVCKTVEEIKNYPNHSVFVTYDSLDKVYESGKTFDVIFGDEAHRMAKAGPKGTKIWDFNTPIIWGTATPKSLSAALKAMGANVPSMDNEDLFGEEAYTVPIRQLINEGYLSDYRIVIMAVDDEEVEKFITNRGFVDDSGYVLNAEDAAFYIAMEKVRDEYGVKRGISYHQTIRGAEECATRLRSLGFKSSHIEAKTPDNERRRILGNLSSEGIITNARTLQEGIDIPTLDAVCFASPKRSRIDIVQSVGRALRLDAANPNKVGYIVLPVVINKDADGVVELDNSNFSHIFSVLRYMADQDDAVRAEIEEIRVGAGANPRVVNNLPARIIVSTAVAGMTKEEMAKEINLHIVHNGVSEDWWSKAKACVADYDAMKPQALYSRGTPFGDAWGNWLGTQRKWALNKDGSGYDGVPMPKDRIAFLKTRIPQWIQDEGEGIQEKILNFCKEHGHTPFSRSENRDERLMYDRLWWYVRRDVQWAKDIIGTYPPKRVFLQIRRVDELAALTRDNRNPNLNSHQKNFWVGLRMSKFKNGAARTHDERTVAYAERVAPWLFETKDKTAIARAVTQGLRNKAIDAFADKAERLGELPDTVADRSNVSRWKAEYRDGKLTPEQIERLESCSGWEWQAKSIREQAVERFVQDGLAPSASTVRRWRMAYREGRLEPQCIDMLNACEHWSWE